MAKQNNQQISFSGKMVIMGCGAVSHCFQILLLRHFAMDFSKVYIIDPIACTGTNKNLLDSGAHFIQKRIDRHNFLETYQTLLSSGDILIDLAVDIDTGDTIDWCQKNNILYINASVEWWDSQEDIHTKHLTNRTLYARHMALIKRASKDWSKNGPTAVVEHGANPGLVSHWTKSALDKIAHKILETIQDITPERKQALEEAVRDRNFPKIAQITGTKVIHISERDTQITNNPKRVDEFVNTWSIPGLYEEGTAPAELGWGTHEKTLPVGAETHSWGPKNQICLSQMGMNTWMYSWIPSGQIIGMLIRHGEAFSISKYLTVWDNEQAVYRPTVHYVYLPTDSTCSSLHELKMHEYKLQKDQRVLYDDIIDGTDELGVLLLGHDLNGWWEGSQLSIQETRELVGIQQQNATTLQVAASLLGALFWMIKNPTRGFNTPDDLPYEEILEVAKPYLGPCPSLQTDWNPLAERCDPLKVYKKPVIKDPDDLWQFENFRAN